MPAQTHVLVPNNNNSPIPNRHDSINLSSPMIILLKLIWTFAVSIVVLLNFERVAGFCLDSDRKTKQITKCGKRKDELNVMEICLFELLLMNIEEQNERIRFQSTAGENLLIYFFNYILSIVVLWNILPQALNDRWMCVYAWTNFRWNQHFSYEAKEWN